MTVAVDVVYIAVWILFILVENWNSLHFAAYFDFQCFQVIPRGLRVLLIIYFVSLFMLVIPGCFEVVPLVIDHPIIFIKRGHVCLVHQLTANLCFKHHGCGYTA